MVEVDMGSRMTMLKETREEMPDDGEDKGGLFDGLLNESEGLRVMGSGDRRELVNLAEDKN